jgi:hypothetical protein
MWTNLLGHNCQRRSGGFESGWKGWKASANFMRWRESWGVSFRTFKSEKQKIKVFRIQTPLITSWFHENIWLNATNSGFSKSLHKIWEGRNAFWKGVCVGPFYLPLTIFISETLRVWKCMQDISQGIARRVSECLLFNTNAAMLQVYHGENNLIVNEMMNRKK